MRSGELETRCEACGEAFLHRRDRARRYCSFDCRVAGKRASVTDLACVDCATMFSISSSLVGKVVRCTDCRKAKTVPNDCKTCGQSFDVPAHMADRYSRCPKCRAKGSQVEKTCPVCERAFSVYASNAHRYRVCSQACRTADTRYVACARCGKTFRAARDGASEPCCSEECRRPPVIEICKHCGKSFRRSPGNRVRRFCTRSCFRRYRGETLTEITAREALTALRVSFVQEARVGRYRVDFLLQDGRVAMEVDGDYWHRDAEKDRRRDAFLLGQGIRVVRIPASALMAPDPVAVIRRYLPEDIAMPNEPGLQP